MLYVCVPKEYKNDLLFGSWNNWEEPKKIANYDFRINDYYIFIFNCNSASYKIKIGDKYNLMNGFLTKQDGCFMNNYVYHEGNTIFNGFHVIKIFKGYMKIYKKNNLIFEGQMNNWLPNGKCKNYYDNGIINFNGYYKNGRRNGEGSEYCIMGKLNYKGNFSNDKANGLGILYLNGKKIYEGQFQNDFMHGYGKIYNPNGKILYDGVFIHDKVQDRDIYDFSQQFEKKMNFLKN